MWRCSLTFLLKVFRILLFFASTNSDLAWLRIVFANGPRQVINALTLYSVMQADLLPAGKHTTKDGNSLISQFWTNISILANHNREQAAILFGMLFTLIIWVFSALGLLLACLMYIIFLWHHIPDNDGTLARFCRRKVDSRLAKIVGVKVKKALAKEDAARIKKAAKAGERPGQIKRQPTLPVMNDESQQKMTPGSLSRQTTATTLESQASYPSSGWPTHQATELGRQPTIPRISMNVDQLSGPSRSTTQSSVRSANSSGSDVPLIGSAAPLGRSAPKHTNLRPPFSPSGYGQYQQNGGMSIPRKPLNNAEDGRPPYNSLWPSTPNNRILRNLPPRPTRQKVDISGQESSINLQSNMLLYHDPSVDNNGRRKPSPSPFAHPPMQGQRQLQQEMVFRPTLPLPPLSRSPPGNNSGYIAYNPVLHGPQSEKQARTAAQLSAPSRNLTLPSRSVQHDYFTPHPPATLPPPRSGTAPVPQNAMYGVEESDYGRAPRPPILPRAATAGPDGRLWTGQGKPVYHLY